mmetsp:Transcript_10233/g.22148  ORF Transcript_10233/g.22148 Transcript_10233/m.22148 type:complete len:103 (-) Transcript_10233:391-699(-)
MYSVKWTEHLLSTGYCSWRICIISVVPKRAERWRANDFLPDLAWPFLTPPRYLARSGINNWPAWYSIIWMVVVKNVTPEHKHVEYNVLSRMLDGFFYLLVCP